jgi:YVTN family beta-propeller protein
MGGTRATLVVVQKDDHSLGLYDYPEGGERARVALPRYPHEFAVDAEGRFSYQCHFGVRIAEEQGPGGDEVSMVDLARREHVRSISCAPWRRPHGIALDRRGALYVLSEASSRLLVIPEPRTGGVERDQPTGGHGSHILSVDSEGRHAWCSNMRSASVTRIDLAGGSAPCSVPVGERPEGSAFDADESRLIVTNRESATLSVIDTATAHVVATIPTPPGPVRIARRPDGRFAVACYHDRSVVVVDIDRGRVELRVALPASPVSIALDASGARALAGLLPAGIAVVDLDHGAVAATIATRAGPDPMAIVELPA